MYFSRFPKSFYSIDLTSQSPKVVTDIFSRFKIRSTVLQNSVAFYKYQIVDGDTPEIVSFKQYNDPQYHWIICMCNDLIDGQFGFPLPISSLEKNILQKYNYTVVEQAMANTHHYELDVEKIITYPNGFSLSTSNTLIVTLDQYDYSSNTLVTMPLNTPTTETVTLRANNADLSSEVLSTITLTSTYKEVSEYDYEIGENEAKREIKILKKQYIESLTSELDTVLNG